MKSTSTTVTTGDSADAPDGAANGGPPSCAICGGKKRPCRACDLSVRPLRPARKTKPSFREEVSSS